MRTAGVHVARAQAFWWRLACIVSFCSLAPMRTAFFLLWHDSNITADVECVNVEVAFRGECRATGHSSDLARAIDSTLIRSTQVIDTAIGTIGFRKWRGTCSCTREESVGSEVARGREGSTTNCHIVFTGAVNRALIGADRIDSAATRTHGFSYWQFAYSWASIQCLWRVIARGWECRSASWGVVLASAIICWRLAIVRASKIHNTTMVARGFLDWCRTSSRASV